MGKYKSYEDWRNRTAIKPTVQTEPAKPLGLQLPGDPLSPTARKMGVQTATPKEPTYTWVDDFFLFDFVGNALWGFGETFVVPTVADVASEVSGGPDLSAQFGSQDWKDESLAGKLGYALGTGGGVLTGIGAVGKGIGLTSKLAGAGMKKAVQEAGKRAVKDLSDDVAKGIITSASDDAVKTVIKSTRTQIDEAGKEAAGSYNWFNYFKRKEAKMNPFNSSPELTSRVTDNVRKEITEMLTKELGEEGVKKAGKESFDESVERMTSSVINAASQTRHVHFGQSITHKLIERGWNKKMAILAGDMAYESVLLATWDVIAGETGDFAAQQYGLNENEWGYEEWYKRAMHGAQTGAILAPIRYIPGGKAVQFGKAGMIADFRAMGSMLRARFGKSAKNQNDSALLAFVNSFSKGADDIGAAFPGAGLTKAGLDDMISKVGKGTSLTANEREILEAAYNGVKKSLGGKDGLIRKLQKEIVRDGFESFTRASVGSLAMNARAYSAAYDSGILFTEEYPMDKLVFDHWVGMLYMKRGKKFDPKSARLPKYYDQTGLNGNGSEIQRFLQSYERLGFEPVKNDIYNAFTVGDVESAIKLVTDQAAKDSSIQISEFIESSRAEYVDTNINQQRLQESIDNKVKFDQRPLPFQTHVQKKIGDLIKLQAQQKKNNETEAAAKTAKEVNDLQNLLNIATKISSLSAAGMVGKQMKYMTQAEALEYIKTFDNFKLNDGTVIDSSNLDLIDTKVELAKLKITENIQQMGHQYIKDSLGSIGLDSIVTESNGKLHVHETVREALKTISLDYAGKPIADAAHSLLETIDSAKAAGSLDVSSKGVAWNQEKIELGKLEKMLEIYNTSTESMHELMFNGMNGKKMDNWRENVPGFTKPDAGFKDKYIMGQTAIWQSVQAANRIKRSRLVYEVLGKQGGGSPELQAMYASIQKKLGGNSRFRVVEEVKQGEIGVEASMEANEIANLERINRVLELFDNTGKTGARDITKGEFETLSKDLNKAFGNIFESSSEYNAFMNVFVYREYANELTGNPNLTSGLRRVLVNMMDRESLLKIKSGGSVVIRSAESLRQSVVRLNLPPAERDALLNKITEYENKVEVPLKGQLKNTKGIIKFGDKPIDLDMPGRERQKLLQEIESALAEVNKFHVSESANLLIDNNKIQERVSNMMAQAESILDTKPELAKELVSKVMEISTVNENVLSLIQKYMATNDAIGLRTLMDVSEKMQQFEQKLTIGDPNKATSKTLDKLRQEFESIVIKALDKRNELGRFETYEDVQNYIADRINNVLNSDRVGRPHQTHTSISPSQYESKWGVSAETMTDIMTNPKLLFERLDQMQGQVKTNIMNNLGMKSITYREMLVDGINSVIRGTFTEKDYIRIVMKPFIDNMKPLVEAHITRQKKSGKEPGTYEDFILDTMFLMQSALGSKKVHLAKYENGMVHIEEASISNWNVGINKLQQSLGLFDVGDILLFSPEISYKGTRSSSLPPEQIQKVYNQLAAGLPIAPNIREVMSTNDILFFDKFKSYVGGKGKKGQLELIPVQLDEKTVVIIPQYSMQKVTKAWSLADGPLRSQLINELATTAMPVADAARIVENYFKRELGATMDSKGNFTIEPNAENVQRLVSITRLLNAFSGQRLADVMAGNTTVTEVLSDLKYIKLDSPRGGFALTQRNLETAKFFLETFIDPNSNMREVVDIYNKQFFGKDGKTLTKHRTLNLFDESGAGASFFGTKELAKEQLRQQIQFNNPKLKESEIQERVDLIMESYETVHASAQNGEKYLSLPEMAAMLMSKGARTDWFIWGDKLDINGKIVYQKDSKGNFIKDKNDRFVPVQTVVGFNVAIKPIEMYKHFDPVKGELITHVGKTAYKYHPEMDKLMKIGGDYFTDSIGFESTHKIHEVSNGVETRKPGVHLERIPGETDFQKSMFERGLPQESVNEVVEIGREGIMIKSIAGIHDATLSYGFGNLMSNKAIRSLAEMTGQNNVVSEMIQTFSSLSENPFAYQKVVTRLKNFEHESGGTINKLIGAEAVLNANGLPLFEFMQPSVEKMVSSDYMGGRNFASSSVSSGKYNVMSAGSGYSLPDRRGGVQHSFGGSGMSHSEHSTDISSMYKISGGKVERLNPREGISLVFKINENMINKFFKGNQSIIGIETGMDVVITHDGHILGPHQQYMRKTAGSLNKVGKQIIEFEQFILDSYNVILESAVKSEGVRTLGDLAMYLNGTLDNSAWKLGDYNKTYELNSHSNKADVRNENAASTVTQKMRNFVWGTGKTGNDFQSVHLAKVDLRVPKVGMNDWVITRVEKLLDRRRGPVSEMNYLDVIQPQDADFDLDKSSSFFALPGEVVREAYNVAGYNDPASMEVFDKAFSEVKLDNPLQMTNYAAVLKQLESKRAPLMRQISTLSTLLQYISTKQELFKPGTAYSQSIIDGKVAGANKNFKLFEFNYEGEKYIVELKNDAAFVDAMTHTKNLIKSTIDIYKERGNIEQVDMVKEAWLNPDHGFLNIRRSKVKDKAEIITYEELPSAVNRDGLSPKASIEGFIQKILRPMDRIHNLIHMTESFADGTSRKMSAFEMLYKYEQNLSLMKFASFKRDNKGNLIFDKNNKVYQQNEYGSIVDNLLGFLGEGYKKGQTRSGLSANPVIQAMVGLRNSRENFHKSIPSESSIAEVVLGLQTRDSKISDAVKKYLKDQKTFAGLESIIFNIDKIEDVVNSMQRKGLLNTASGKYWQAELKRNQMIRDNIVKELNDPANIYDLHKTSVLRKDRKGVAQNHIAIYRRKGDETFLVGEFKQGERYKARKGDVIYDNPGRIILGDKTVNMVRRAMHDAFARDSRNFNETELLMVRNLMFNPKNGFFKTLSNERRNYTDPSKPLDSRRLSLMGEVDMVVMADFLQRVKNISPAKAEQIMQQFLFDLLVPKVSDNTWEIIGKDSKGNNLLSPSFQKNTTNERMVFKFLNKAMRGEAENVMSIEQATQIFQRLNDRFKTAFVKQHDGTLQGDVFNFETSKRKYGEFGFISPLKDLPNFVFDVNLERQGQDLMLQFVNGSYFMDPVQLYRMTYNLSNQNKMGPGGTMPSHGEISSVMKGMWEGSSVLQLGKDGAWYQPKKTFRDNSFHNGTKTKEKSALEELQEIWTKCF